MFQFSSDERLFLTFSTAVGLIAAGVLNGLFAPRPIWARWLLANVGFAAALVSVDSFVPQYTGSYALLGSGLSVFAFLVGVPAVRRVADALRARLGHPRAVWGIAAFAGAAWLGAELYLHQRTDDAAVRNDEIAMMKAVDHVLYVSDDSRVALTDRGSPIHLLIPSEFRTTDELLDAEQQMFQRSNSDEYLIRRGPADDATNCHGWVFAAGKFAVAGHEVPRILEENGYESTSDPKAGDLCIYREAGDTVAHSSIVRGVFDDGTVLVEGKWGRCGVFLHPVQHSCYGTNFSYYRTERKSHVLHAIP